jgi:glucose uptake protein GlcU
MHLNIPTGTLLSLIIPLIALELILVVVALVDLIRREPERVNGNKIMWALIIIIVGTIGPILYLIVGRRELADDRF